MHADGNDFLLVDARYAGPDGGAQARALCDRHRGVGADGVEWFTETDSGPRIELSNADGSHAEISGNGTRCMAAWWAMRHGGGQITIETDAGARECSILHCDANSATVAIAMRVFHWQRMAVQAGGRQWNGVAVNLGNPHFVIANEQIPADWQRSGALLTGHEQFPHGCNVEFVRVDAPDAITFRIYERGAGPTQSSGTGTTASAVAAIATLGVASKLNVRSEGGEQQVEWRPENENAILTGSAHFIARGEAAAL